MGIDFARFWTNFHLYNYKSIRTNRHSTFGIIDDLCALNDGGEFGKAFVEIYPTELELKEEHNCSHETFLDLVFL